MLTTGLIAVGLIGLRIQKDLLIVILSVLAPISARMLYRIRYWGKLSHRIIWVPIEKGKETSMVTLHEAAVARVEKESFFFSHAGIRLAFLAIIFGLTWIVLWELSLLHFLLLEP